MASPTVETKPKTATQTPGPTNGNKPASPLTTSGEGASAPGAGKDEEAKVSRGVIPQMPSCVVWREPADKGGKVVANLIHPRSKEIFSVRGKGVNGTMGTLGDEGYPLGGLRAEGPKWLEEFIPEGVEVLGYAPVLGFPIPKQ